MSLHHQYINNESKLKNSINIYENIFSSYKYYIPSLNEALYQMFISSKIPFIKIKYITNQIITKVNEHLKKNFFLIRQKYPDITYEDAQIITSYTCELDNEEDYNYNPYKILNTNLVSNDRMIGIKNISKYLYIFLKSLRKLDRYTPESYGTYLYRCISKKVELNYDFFDNKKIPYLRGQKKMFWSFSSASTNPQTAFCFLDKNKAGTLFSLTGEDIWGYDITLFNIYNEEEILLEPEREILIEESIPPLNGVIYVRCRIKKTPLVLENIIKPKINSNNNLNKDIEKNLNIIQNINESNKNWQNEPLSKINNNNHINNNISNTIPDSLKYSSFTYNNNCTKNTLNYLSNQKILLFKSLNKCTEKNKISNNINNNYYLNNININNKINSNNNISNIKNNINSYNINNKINNNIYNSYNNIKSNNINNIINNNIYNSYNNINSKNINNKINSNNNIYNSYNNINNIINNTNNNISYSYNNINSNNFNNIINNTNNNISYSYNNINSNNINNKINANNNISNNINNKINNNNNSKTNNNINSNNINNKINTNNNNSKTNNIINSNNINEKILLMVAFLIQIIILILAILIL